jgi:hypothetical protein
MKRQGALIEKASIETNEISEIDENLAGASNKAEPVADYESGMEKWNTGD